ncbi:MAG: hypothetical protein RL268_14 [Pseudomonadota bacterium]|jgi:4-hydroxy-tetrahydrodipicolinate reductase
MKRVKVLLFGVGQVGLVAAKQLLDENYDIVGAFSQDKNIGKDIGTLAVGAPIGVLIEALAGFQASKFNADAALFCTSGSPYDLLESPAQCLSAGINVVTIAEGATYPWTYDADLSAKIDEIARNGGASITSTGMTDTYMVHLAAVAASTVPAVTAIKVYTVGDFGRLGPAALSAMPLGLLPEDFVAMLQNPPPEGAIPPPSISGQCLEALAKLTGVTSRETRASVDFVLAKRPIRIDILDRTLEVGTISGLLETTTMQTEEGIELTINLVAEIFADDQAEMQRIVIDSSDVPSLTVDAGPTPGVEYTAAIAINRIHDVIAAPPGFQTIDRLPAPLFRKRADRRTFAP